MMGFFRPENGKNNILILYFSANNTKDVDAVSSATPMADGVSSVEWVAGIIHDRVGGGMAFAKDEAIMGWLFGKH